MVDCEFMEQTREVAIRGRVQLEGHLCSLVDHRDPDCLIVAEVVDGPLDAVCGQSEEVDGLRGEEDPFPGMAIRSSSALAFSQLLDSSEVVWEPQPVSEVRERAATIVGNDNFETGIDG